MTKEGGPGLDPKQRRALRTPPLPPRGARRPRHPLPPGSLRGVPVRVLHGDPAQSLQDPQVAPQGHQGFLGDKRGFCPLAPGPGPPPCCPHFPGVMS